MIEIFGAIAAVLAVAGVILNNRLMRSCFYPLMASSVICAVLHITVGLWSLAVRDAAFFVLAVEGLYKWRKKGAVERNVK